MLKILDTLSGAKKSLPKGKEIKLFVCGPTVYDYIHIGNARTFVVFDAFVKYLRSRGIKVFYLQNITDIDDKIIRRAKEKDIAPKKLAVFFEKAFLTDMKKLGVDSVTKYARATDHIKEIVKQVRTLIKKSFAYKTNDGYYFDLSAFPDYGKLGKRTMEQAEDATSRIDEGVEKRNRGDFNLWKFHKEGEPYWKTPLGKGRPGWHIEDTAITEHYLGPQYDIHGGGRDLIFPHHEAEIAEQESASGLKPFVKIWMHAGFVEVNGEKMSKSLGNFILARDFLKKKTAEVFRFMVLAHHYRSPLNYTEKLARDAEESLANIKEFLSKLKLAQSSKIPSSPRFQRIPKIQKCKKEFQESLGDDFNTPRAIGEIFKFIGEMNEKIWSLSPKEARETTRFIQDSLGIFGLRLEPGAAPKNIKTLAEKRERKRKSRKFAEADKLRKKIEGLGYSVEDTPLGPYVKMSNAKTQMSNQ